MSTSYAQFIVRGENEELERAVSFLRTCADHLDITLVDKGLVSGRAPAPVGNTVQRMLANGLQGIDVEIFVVNEHPNPIRMGAEQIMKTEHKIRVQVKKGWGDAGRKGTLFTKPIKFGNDWVGVLWDDEEDPDWFKAAGLDVI